VDLSRGLPYFLEAAVKIYLTEAALPTFILEKSPQKISVTLLQYRKK